MRMTCPLMRGCRTVLVASWQAIDLHRDSGLSQQSDHTPEDNPAITARGGMCHKTFPHL